MAQNTYDKKPWDKSNSGSKIFNTKPGNFGKRKRDLSKRMNNDSLIYQGRKLTDVERQELREQRAAEAAVRQAAKDEKLAEYATATLKLPPILDARVPIPVKDNINVTTNFFKVSFDVNRKGEPVPKLHKYEIILDNINNVEPTKRGTRKYLIGEMIKLNPPDADDWITDDFRQILSVGRRYRPYNDGANHGFVLTHIPTGPKGQGPISMD